MFEAEIINAIANINEASLLSTYYGRPSIFSGQAPEDIDFPYIVINIMETFPPDSIITKFDIDINIFDYSLSEVIVRELIFAITNNLDNIIIQSERYADIRLRRNTTNKMEVPDPRGIHYLMTFLARGSREYWSKTI